MMKYVTMTAFIVGYLTLADRAVLTVPIGMLVWNNTLSFCDIWDEKFAAKEWLIMISVIDLRRVFRALVENRFVYTV